MTAPTATDTTRKRLILGFAFTVLCVSMVFGGARTLKRQSPNTNETSIVNRTHALEVVALERTADGHLHVLIKNVARKDVNGYVISLSDNTRITNDTSSGDRVISQGSTDELEIPVQSTPSTLTVLAAMFADGSVEGDPAIVREVKQWRSDLKTQLARGLYVLDETLKSPDGDRPLSLHSLEARFSSLPFDPATTGASSARGVWDGKDSLVNELHLLRSRQQRNGNLNQREHLIELRERIKRRIASL